jgi:hypothetical protein
LLVMQNSINVSDGISETIKRTPDKKHFRRFEAYYGASIHTINLLL